MGVGTRYCITYPPLVLPSECLTFGSNSHDFYKIISRYGVNIILNRGFVIKMFKEIFCATVIPNSSKLKCNGFSKR